MGKLIGDSDRKLNCRGNFSGREVPPALRGGVVDAHFLGVTLASSATPTPEHVAMLAFATPGTESGQVGTW